MKYLDTIFREQDERSDGLEFRTRQTNREQRFALGSPRPAIFPYFATQKNSRTNRKPATSRCKKADVSLAKIPEPRS